MLLRSTLPVLLLALGACASLYGAWLEQLPLPAASQLPCCWQTEEKVEISAPGRDLLLTAAVAVQKDTLTVVVFDPIGRRMATLIHTEGEPQVLAPPGWPPELSRQLLIGLYLHHLSPDQWGFSEEGWSITSTPGLRTLSYHQRQLVKLQYPAHDRAERTLRFVGKGLSVRLTTLSMAEL